jgi:hypothetical protein
MAYAAEFRDILRNSVKVCVYGIPYTFKCRLC